MKPPTVVPVVLVLLASFAGAEEPARPAARPPSAAEKQLLQALAANPITAPYVFQTRTEGRRVLLLGRVGTKQVYDAAVQTAIATGIPFAERLVIDTAEVTRPVAGAATAAPVDPLHAFPSAAWNMPWGGYPSLFNGWGNDPFMAFADPPNITYPPWWGAMSQYRLGRDAAILRAHAARSGPRGRPAEEAPPPPSDVAAETADQPPPPPVPFDVPAEPARPPDVPPPPKPQPPPDAAEAADASPTGRLRRAFADVPGLAGVQVTMAGGVATLRGEVAGVMDAMQAYLIAEQAPGVEAVRDSLSFPPPPPGSHNPLIVKARPEDAAKYLQAQLARQLRDQAEVRAVRIRGDALEVDLRLEDGARAERIRAILRSIPLLRGFRLEPTFEMP